MQIEWRRHDSTRPFRQRSAARLFAINPDFTLVLPGELEKRPGKLRAKVRLPTYSANAQSWLAVLTYNALPTMAGEAKIGAPSLFWARTSIASPALTTVIVPRSEAKYMNPLAATGDE